MVLPRIFEVFLSIFFAYVAMGMAFFGREVESFASFDRALLALLRALCPDLMARARSGFLIAVIPVILMMGAIILAVLDLPFGSCAFPSELIVTAMTHTPRPCT